MRLLGGLTTIVAASVVVPLAASAVASAPATAATAGPAGPSAANTAAAAPATTSAQAARPPAAGNPGGHAYVPPAGRAVSTARPTRVIGRGTPASCTSQAVVQAVARGGLITFSCGAKPVTITMTATAKVVNTSQQVVLNGGGKVTLSGGGRHRILYMNTCDKNQVWTTSHCQDQATPRLTVENLTFTRGDAPGHSPADIGSGSGGAIYAQGGQLKVVNSRFTSNRCYRVGPDLGGAAIRALMQYQHRPVNIVHSTFTGGVCSNGAALSSIGVSWTVLNSVLSRNRAIGHGANPAAAGSPGGGSGGAIYNDGDNYNLVIKGTVMRYDHAREGGGAIFYVCDADCGRAQLRISHSTLFDNPSAGFFTAGYPGIFYKGSGHPVVIDSKIH
jgi:hypothetical protein